MIPRENLFLEFDACGVGIGPSTVSSLINLAGKARQANLIPMLSEDIARLGVQSDPITERSFLLAAGYFGKPESVESNWKALVQARTDHGKRLEHFDWQALAKAGGLANHTAFVETQLAKIGADDQIAQRAVLRELEKLEHPQEQHHVGEQVDATAVEEQLQSLTERAAAIFELLRSDRRRPLTGVLVPTVLHPDQELGPTHLLRKIYDELTTDPTQPATEGGDQEHKTLAGLSYAELRFQNWVSVKRIARHCRTNRDGPRNRESVRGSIRRRTKLRAENAVGRSTLGLCGWLGGAGRR